MAADVGGTAEQTAPAATQKHPPVGSINRADAAPTMHGNGELQRVAHLRCCAAHLYRLPKPTDGLARTVEWAPEELLRGCKEKSRAGKLSAEPSACA
jgi:hypothetical protein